MGKGDPRTKRGKIFKGSNGKFRPTLKKINRDKKAVAESASSSK